MKTILVKKQSGILALALWLGGAGMGNAQVVISPPNYTVTTPLGFEYTVNNQSSGQPAVSGTDDSLNFSLTAGATYIFTVNTASIHPVDICTNPDTISFYTNASAQAKTNASITVTIPATNYPPTLYYICNLHSFYGIITVNPPATPPPASITQTSVTTNIVLTFSGGTNTISAVPQYSSNLLQNAWFPVPAYTNTFTGSGSNNTTSFGRLDAVCGPDVFLRIAQVQK